MAVKRVASIAERERRDVSFIVDTCVEWWFGERLVEEIFFEVVDHAAEE